MSNEEVANYWLFKSLTIFTFDTQAEYEDIESPLKTDFKRVLSMQPSLSTTGNMITFKKISFIDNASYIQFGNLGERKTTYLNFDSLIQRGHKRNDPRGSIIMEVNLVLNEFEGVQIRKCSSLLDFLSDFGGTLASFTIIGHTIYWLISGQEDILQLNNHYFRHPKNLDIKA